MAKNLSWLILVEVMGTSQPTFYNLKFKYGVIDARQLKHLKELEAE